MAKSMPKNTGIMGGRNARDKMAAKKASAQKDAVAKKAASMGKTIPKLTKPARPMYGHATMPSIRAPKGTGSRKGPNSKNRY